MGYPDKKSNKFADKQLLHKGDLMFAHHLIETIKNSHPDSEIAKDSQFQKNTLLSLQSAQKFYLGTDEDLVNFFSGRYPTTPLFSGELADTINMPYENCLLMFDANVHEQNDISKVAINVTSDKGGDTLIIHFWLYEHSAKDWAVFPARLRITDILDLTTVSLLNLKPLLNYQLPKKPTEGLSGHLILHAMRLVNFFLLMINSKNIATTDNLPPPKLNKKRIKNHKQPLFTYKTLVIKPTGKKQEAQAAQGIWENRVHLCRGHFKTFTKDKPLFGRVTGRYWWQPSVRGNKAKGVITKDYIVNAT
jgi:hypothetical protein